jgi:hypothetical protein
MNTSIGTWNLGTGDSTVPCTGLEYPICTRATGGSVLLHCTMNNNVLSYQIIKKSRHVTHFSDTHNAQR